MKEELLLKLDEVMFNEKRRMERSEIVEFLIDEYWDRQEPVEITPEPGPTPRPRPRKIEIEPEIETEYDAKDIYVLYRIDGIKKSRNGKGTYVRHHFINKQTSVVFVLDVIGLTNNIFKSLRIGMALLSPSIINIGGSDRIDGRFSCDILSTDEVSKVKRKERIYKKRKDMLDGL